MQLERKKGWGILSALILAVGFGLIFYICNTPIGPCIGSDNAMYLTMGTALSEGYAPYREIFDHKGPLLFLSQMIPQMTAGPYNMTAVFVQQAAVLFLCLVVLAGMARELSVSPLAAQLLYLALISSVTSGGNLTEEYASLPTLLAIWAALRVFGKRELPEPKKLFGPSLLVGVCALAAFLFRANNALPIAALVLALAVFLAVKKNWKALGFCAGGFTLGLVFCLLPVALWLASHGALWDAFYGSILHNFLYTETGGGSRVQTLLKTAYGHTAILMAALSCMGAAAVYRIRGSKMLACGMAAAAAAGGLAGFLSHKFYLHYLVVGAPMAAFGGAALLALFKKPEAKNRAALITMAACVLVLVVQGVKINGIRLDALDGLDEFTQNAQHLMAQVPEEERDSFMAYRAEPKWYVAAGALPCQRFYFLQEILADADPAVMDEIVEDFETDPPHYLVLYYNRPFSPPYDERVQKIFETEYERIDTAGQYQLLRLKQ